MRRAHWRAWTSVIADTLCEARFRGQLNHRRVHIRKSRHSLVPTVRPVALVLMDSLRIAGAH